MRTISVVEMLLQTQLPHPNIQSLEVFRRRSLDVCVAASISHVLLIRIEIPRISAVPHRYFSNVEVVYRVGLLSTLDSEPQPSSAVFVPD